MEHILDNPIYNALNSGNKNFSNGNHRAKYFLEDVSPLAGLKENAHPDLNVLYENSPAKSFFILFTLAEIEIPGGWKVTDQMRILQMAYDNPVPQVSADREFVALQEQHVPQMLALTKMMNPGPFLSGTIRLGNYMGVFDGGRLVAMAGQRLQPKPFVEVSAVCTHPDYLGKGYASMLITDQINRIIVESEIPFLHVREDNTGAIKLYQKLGFTTRKKMIAYGIQKQEL